jgi:hypothetical protein
MKSAVLIAAAATSALSIVSVAHAQTQQTTIVNTPPPAAEAAPPTAGRRVAAPKNALELGVGVGYSQGVGNISTFPGDRVQDYAGAGIGFTGEIGYRVNPPFMIGAYGQFTEYNANNRLVSGTNVRDVRAGIQANWHFMPTNSFDPWVGLGAGWHAFYVVPDSGPNLTRQGLDVARARLGVDYKVIPEVALGPVIGADMSLFLSQKLGETGYHSIDNERLNFFFFAGLAGRFDLIGEAVGGPATVASR